MTIARNLHGKSLPSELIRTIEAMDARLTRYELMLTRFASKMSSNGNGGLTEQQKSDVSGLIGALSQSVIGQSTPDPVLPGQIGGGTVVSFSAGDLSPLFTTNETNPTTTPALAFTQVNQGANVVFAGPGSGGAAAPSFRALVANDLPTAAVKSTGSKETAGAPYANDGYVDTTVNGVAVRLMTTA